VKYLERVIEDEIAQDNGPEAAEAEVLKILRHYSLDDYVVRVEDAQYRLTAFPWGLVIFTVFTHKEVTGDERTRVLFALVRSL
jgi:hypothetical protein